MAIDPYHYCPHGSGKKYKFCCPKLLQDYEKLDRLFDNHQISQARSLLDRLLAKHTTVCLLSQKALVEIEDRNYQQAEQIGQQLREQFPEVPTGWALAVIGHIRSEHLTAAINSAQQAVEKAIATSTPAGLPVPGLLVEGLFLCGQAAIMEHCFVAGLAHLLLAVQLSGSQQEKVEAFREAFQAKQISPLLKSQPPWREYHTEETPQPPWIAQYNSAVVLAKTARWQAALELLRPLVEQHPQEAILWETIGWSQACLAQEQQAAAAFHKLAALDHLPLDERVEAEAIAQVLGQATLQQLIDEVEIEYTVTDLDPLQRALLSDPRVRTKPVQTQAWTEQDQIPPLNLFQVLDRPWLKDDQPLTPETCPCVIGDLALYGKQTDRDARLEVVTLQLPEEASSQDADPGSGDPSLSHSLQEWLKPFANHGLGSAGQRKVVRKIPYEERLLHSRKAPPERDIPELRGFLLEEAKRVILKQWPQTKLQRFGNRSLAELAADPQSQVTALGAILAVELRGRSVAQAETFSRLRDQLGLAQPEPISPKALQETGQRLESLPLVAMRRLVWAELSDEELLEAYQEAHACRFQSVVYAAAEELIDRESLHQGNPESLTEFHSQRILASPTLEDSLKAIEEARRATQDLLDSDGQWDIFEAQTQLKLGHAQEAQQLLQGLARDHKNEPKIMAQLEQILMTLGLIGPDGQPRQPDAEMAPEQIAPEEISSGVLSDLKPKAAPPSALWTPESGQPPNPSTPPPKDPQGPSESGLWLPD